MKHVSDRIDALVAGELDQAEAQVVAEHVAGCPQCAREEARARDLWQQLAGLAVPPELPSRSAWPDIQARTFGVAGNIEPVRNRWGQAALATVALAAGLALAVLLPSAGPDKIMVATDDDPAWGSSFWLSEQSDSSLSEMWLAAADGESGS